MPMKAKKTGLRRWGLNCFFKFCRHNAFPCSAWGRWHGLVKTNYRKMRAFTHYHIKSRIFYINRLLILSLVFLNGTAANMKTRLSTLAVMVVTGLANSSLYAAHEHDNEILDRVTVTATSSPTVDSSRISEKKISSQRAYKSDTTALL